MSGKWPALAAATARDDAARVPFTIDGRHVGSVARAHLPALAQFGPALSLRDGTVELAVPAPDRDEALAQINTTLRSQGLIVAWRDETYAIVDPATQRLLAHTERAAARFWGTLTFGAHATGYVAGPTAGPRTCGSRSARRTRPPTPASSTT